MKKWFYNLVYRFVPVDWVFGSTSKIESFVDQGINGRIEPCKAITLGCGAGRETIHLARKGFIVTGVDYSPTAIKQARRRAEAASVDVQFFEDDLTNLSYDYEEYDLVTDFGALNDLSQKARDLYMKNVLPLIKSGGKYLMFCFDRMLPSDEVRTRFEKEFEIEIINKRAEPPGLLVLYLMTRNSEFYDEEVDV